MDGNRLQHRLRLRNGYCARCSLFATRMETHSISDISTGSAFANTLMVGLLLRNVKVLDSRTDLLNLSKIISRSEI